jgi:hypothetical protein
MGGRVSFQGGKDARLFIFGRIIIGHEGSQVWVDDIVMVKRRESRSVADAIRVLLMERRALVIFDVAHMLMSRIMSLVTGRARPPTQ